MSNHDSQKEKQADPQHGNKYWNHFRLAAPYIFSLILLVVIFSFFSEKKSFIFFSFAFFLILALWLLLSGSKLTELYFAFIYLPIYWIFLVWYLLARRRGGKK